MIISCDFETNGSDFFHGTQPFYCTVCFEDFSQHNFEWKVDPLTRRVDVEQDDVEQIRKYIDDADRIVGQNFKYDSHCLTTIGIEFPFEKLEDTLIASHVLASGMPHDLTNLVRRYLPPRYDIEKYEKDLDEAAISARRYARSKLKDWMIAHEQLPCMPSLKGSPHKYDLWLPKCVAEHEGFDKDHEHYNWHTVLETYASHDSAAVLALWSVMERELKKQGLWKIYRCRMELPSIAKKMEHYGITANVSEINRLEKEYTEESVKLETICVNIAKGYNYELDLPKGPRNKNLETFLFDVMKLPVLEYTESDKPSLNAEVKERYENELKRGTKQQLFMKSYNRKTELEKAVGTLKSYRKFGVPTDDPKFIRLHPNLNPTGTSTLQWSSSNPNAQNISEQSSANLRKVFGPVDGREWWSLDGKNLQLRIPAFEVDEKELVEVFLNPDVGPYYGSYHLFIFDIVHPEKFREYGAKVKDADNPYYYLYKAVKNGNFARQFGAQKAKVDATFGIQGAFDKIANRFPKIDFLSRKYVALANRQGYVETIPDISQDPTRGYPLMTERNEWQTVSPTIPFCYHIAGTAQQWMYRGMTRVENQLVEWRKEGFDAWMICQVHDEILIDAPKGQDKNENLPRINILKELLEVGGTHIGIPTPVSVDYHPVSWAVAM